MRIVLDTNALISSLSERLNFEIILDSLLNGEYELYLTNSILLEYETKITDFFDKSLVALVLEYLDELPNVHKIQVYYSLNLIETDKSDNKFIDCSFVCNADYIITNDKHFNILKNIEHPKINILSIEKFAELLQSKNK